MTCSAAVAITVRGHSAFTPMPSDGTPPPCRARTCSCRTSPSCTPRAARTSCAFMLSGGDRFRMCGLRPAFADCLRYGRHACEQTNVPRTLTPNIRSKRFIGVSSVPDSEMALALFTRMSMPPKRSAHCFAASATAFSSRMSTCIGQRLAAGLLDLARRGVNRAGQLRMRLIALGGDRDVGAVARRADCRSPGRCRATRR